ncbi:hypothetical protein L6164_011644 [Bauhinia variegata]|uniref:Uncharacterized protein n=1 Tax=Bauhinia variegata TaxID=167791 RepID=A0ACB9P6S5_BAUVA|nr:hypothetical protein L6164_011644 [Bauhinia variegata]
MDYESESGKFLDKSLSVGCSSRVSYYRSGDEGVPFKWEMQPGKAKEPPKEEMLPPLSPPPALLSLGLPKPCIQEPKPSMRSRLIKFWNKSIKSTGTGESKKLQACSYKDDVDDVDVFDIFTRFDQCSSDSESMASPQDSSSSSSSFAKSRSSLKSTSSESPTREIYRWPLNCIPMQIPRIPHIPLLRRD